MVEKSTSLYFSLRIMLLINFLSNRCTLGDKFYVLDEELSSEVISESSAVKIQGIYVSITLKKATEGN